MKQTRFIATGIVLAAFLWVGVALALDKEGTVQSVDSMQKTISLEDGSRLVLEDTTHIMTVEGKVATLEDLKAGAKVKASYEEKDGKHVATMIEIVN